MNDEQVSEMPISGVTAWREALLSLIADIEGALEDLDRGRGWDAECYLRSSLGRAERFVREATQLDGRAVIGEGGTP